MLTDVFVHRYQNTKLREEFSELDRVLMVQGYRIIFEQLFPFWVDGKENTWSKDAIKQVHDRLSMELGLSELSQTWYSYQTTWNGNPHTTSGQFTLDRVCKAFICKQYDGSVPVSRFLAERISFFELAFRMREEKLKESNANLPDLIADAKLRASRKRSFSTASSYSGASLTLPGDPREFYRVRNEAANSQFRNNVDELNARFRQAGYSLNYHNGFIQMADDVLSQREVERPFWEIVSAELWKNVDIDMKEAIDRRDNSGRDPAFYAAKALESAIKIISQQKGFTTGGERGAADYINNLNSAKNGRFIDVWEAESLKAFFSKVRNPFGHGPGMEEMPELTPQQTDWAIESCMIWVKSLVRRL